MFNDAVELADVLSVTLTAKLKLPAEEGVPVIEPPWDKVSPAGNCPPVSDQEYGGVPPVADIDAEYDCPDLAAGSDVVVTESGGGGGWEIVMVKEPVAELDALSVTRAVKLDVPAAEGVPVIEPLWDRVSPPGSCPSASDHAYGGVPPVAESVAEYGWPD
jgi:hypothetical protein